MKRNIAEFKTPIGGQTGNFLNVRNWISGILGTIFFFAVIAIGLLVVRTVAKAAGKGQGTITEVAGAIPIVRRLI